MQVREKTRREIEEKLKTLGNYVKIDYLLSCLKQPIDFDTRRFILLELTKLYEEKKMFLEAGKMINNAAPINTAFSGKIADFVKAAELFVKGGSFDQADVAFDKALASCNEKQKQEVKNKKIDFYKQQAELYLQNDKRHSALSAYEKLLTLNLGETERRLAQERLLGLYERLGKIREFYALKRGM